MACLNYLRSIQLLGALCILVAHYPASAQWEKIGPPFEIFKNDGFYGYADGVLYMFGGKLGTGTLLTECSTLNTENPEAWITKAPLPTTRIGGYAGLYNGKFYLVGGLINYTGTPTIYNFASAVLEYDPATDTYTEKTSIPLPVYEAAGAVVGSKIYLIAGGARQADNPQLIEESRKVQVYDMATDVWSTTTDAPFTDEDYSMATAIGNTIYYFGNRTQGEPYGYKGVVGETIQWSPIADCPEKPFAGACGVMGNTVYIAGGAIQSGNPNYDTYYYDEPNDTWIKNAELPEPGFFVPVLLGDGTALYYISGTGNFNTYRLSLTTGVAESNDETPALRIYPNPASEAVTIELPSAAPCTLAMFSALGEKVLTQSANSSTAMLDTHTLPPGLYTVRYASQGSTRYYRLILK